MTVPRSAAEIGAPHGELMSTPAWNLWVPKIGWVRHPKPEVIDPGDGQKSWALGFPEPLDAVARFHLGNGAALERLNWMGDSSELGMARSAGIMVNYVYWLDELEKNHVRYFREHVIAASPQVLKLAKECSLNGE